GTAWAQRRGIDRVEVRVDDGPWQDAALADEYSIDTWRMWSWTWDAPPGLHTLHVRQPTAPARHRPRPAGARSPTGPPAGTAAPSGCPRDDHAPDAAGGRCLYSERRARDLLPRDARFAAAAGSL